MKRLTDFLFAKTNLSVGLPFVTKKELRFAQKSTLKGADTAILMMATNTKCSMGSVSGVAFLGPPQIKGLPPVGWVSVRSPRSSVVESFTHEVGHLFGCRHNRETFKDGGHNNETGYGYLVNGTRYHTTMAYETRSHDIWIPYFSSKDLTYKGFPIGDAQNDNRAKLIQNRFLLAQVGDESGTCSATVNSCAGLCLRSVKLNLPIQDREVSCRDLCGMPSTGYYNLNGQKIGIEDVNLTECNNTSQALRWQGHISLALMCVTIVLWAR